jgi:hypothetical protein
MMFLLRTAFWLSVVLALLPTFASKQPTAVPVEIGATQAVTAAGATISDLSGFCERQPDACAAGAQLATAFGQRTREGAKIVYDFVGDRLAKPERAAVPAPEAVEARPSQNTLTAGDITPAWRGPKPRRDAAGRRAS